MDINVEHIAKLARLGLNESDKKKFQQELSAVLDFVEKLKEADTSQTEPMAGGTFLNNVFRDDESKPVDKEQRTEILDNAPEKKDNFIKVKAVFE